MMIYMIRRMSVNYSWIIGIVAGCVTDAIVIIVSFSLLMVDMKSVTLIVSCILSSVILILYSTVHPVHNVTINTVRNNNFI